MAKMICFIGGSKGGVGKSMATMATLDYLQQQGESVLLIETDTSNPDVWKAYKDSVDTALINLDEADGWAELANTCERTPDSVVVINTAARNAQPVLEHGSLLNDSLTGLKRKLVTLWMINRQRDSLELLKEYMKAMPDAAVHVVRNAHAGKENMFAFYNESNMRATVEGRGGKSVMFPKLAHRVADEMNIRRLSVVAALQEMPIGNRAELLRWRNEVEKMWAEILDA